MQLWGYLQKEQLGLMLIAAARYSRRQLGLICKPLYLV